MVQIKRMAQGLDMYRKVPADLLEGSRRGSFLSYGALFVMLTLFLMETRSFFSGPSIVTDVALDANDEQKVRVNFNITMLDLKCDYAVIDVVSSLGTEQNVTQNVNKYSLDGDGIRNVLHGRNKQQTDIIKSDERVTQSLTELYENGEDAISLDATTFEFAKHKHEFLFVDYYASWCNHCQNLAPTWETLAEVMAEAAMFSLDESFHHNENEAHDYSEEEYMEALHLELPVRIAKIDCVDHKELCSNEFILGYPTLRLFVHGHAVADYHGDRTVTEMTNWLAAYEDDYKSHLPEDKRKVIFADSVARDLLDVSESREDLSKPPEKPKRKVVINHDDDYDLSDPNGEKTAEEIEWSEKMDQYERRQKSIWREEDHPGCQISGYLYVDRVPGNFHIQARSPYHDIAAHMTNVSHEIHHLSFGTPGVIKAVNEGRFSTPDNFAKTMNPLDGNVYVNWNEHESFHHYLKIITTKFTTPFIKSKFSTAYQLLSSSQLSYYRDDIVPEAKFSYDPSPIAVYHRREYSTKWYDYITSIMAIIGGTFTVVGMLENSVHAVTTKKRR